MEGARSREKLATLRVEDGVQKVILVHELEARAAAAPVHGRLDLTAVAGMSPARVPPSADHKVVHTFRHRGDADTAETRNDALQRCARVPPAIRRNSLNSFAMNCGPLSLMIVVRASGKTHSD